MVSIIVAMSRNRVIGKDNKLIWHLPADLKHFKNTTMGRPVIMGRKTFESVGKPLPGRTNIVISRNKNYNAPGCLMAGSVEEALRLLTTEPANVAAFDTAEVFIAGGGEIYRQAIQLAGRMYITVIDHDFEGDTFFPEFSGEEWKLTGEEYRPADEKNSYPMLFRIYDRVLR
jgi:dihydrofolate reductase